MIKHLFGSGYAITECGLTSAIPKTLTADLADMTCGDCRTSLIRRGVCPECDGKTLTWATRARNITGAPDGRLRVVDVETTFLLACGDCSATLLADVGPEVIAIFLTAHGWRP
jgi:hypothetical protein